MYNRIRAEVPPPLSNSTSLAIDDHDPELLDMCARVITEGIEAMAALIANSYLAEISQLIVDQSNQLLPPEVQARLTGVSYADLVSREALVLKLEQIVVEPSIQVCNHISSTTPLYTQL